MLTCQQIEEYKRVGALVVQNVISQDELEELRKVTDEFVEKSRAVARNNDIYDLEETHTSDRPRIRRIKCPELHHAAYRDLVHHRGILTALESLIGPNIRFDLGKLNMKDAGGGAAVEWHQDGAFYPHTNDDLAAVGVMIDAMELSHGPLMVIAGSHRGPVFDHHAEGKFCGAMDPERRDVDYATAVPLTGSAGSITIHHARTIHGSAPNTSNKQRRLLLLQYRAADAWPLLGFPQGWDAFEELLVAAGFDALSAIDGRTAMEAVDHERVDAMVLDYQLPDMTGLALMQEVHRRMPRLPVVMITGYADVRGAVAAMRAGVIHYLAKPFSNKELVAAIRAQSPSAGDALLGRSIDE